MSCFASSADDVLANAHLSLTYAVSGSISRTDMTPALMRATKIAKKSGEYKKITNGAIIDEVENILNIIRQHDEQISSSEMGEILFLLSALASKSDIDAEEALFKKTNSFIVKYKN